ncbi:hypothetical protein M758_5G079400 [Ceratodon purpureus]|nr:hypothetical protein M758_5G079400 [Ceratodon purpureus]
MAMLLDASVVTAGYLAPAASSSAATSSRCVVGLGVTRGLPVCRGLRLGASSRVAVSRDVRGQRRGGAIVCEAQETVTGVAGVVNESTWKSLVGECDVPVLVDFWAPWCGPCRMIAPIIDQIAKDYAGKVRCLKLNTDESPNIATEFGIRSIPTVMVFMKGEKKDTVIGAVPMQTLTATLDKYIA